MIVRLAWSEVALAADVGLLRNLRALQDRREPRYGAPSGAASWSLHITGAIGEYVVAKLFDIHWNPSVGLRGRSDVGGDDDPPMTLELRKFHFSAPLRQASTGADGSCSELFRTQGDLFIRVISRREEQPFSLLLWIDEAKEPAMPPVIVPKGAGR
jgi:hypothetical protein